MCGFVGHFHTKITDDESVILNMLEQIKHRGPDSQKTYTDESLSLGFARLALVGLGEAGDQPMFNQDKSLVLVFNGEIYNYKELKKELVSEGYVFSTETDSEVLLHGYAAWGEDLLQKLRGMYAFVIWNTKTQELFCARDHFGIKPFYYYHHEGVFLFGSELKSFLPHPEFKKEFDSQYLQDYLTFSCVPGGEHTFLKNVKKLLPGSSALYNFKTDTLTIKKYFTPQFDESSDKSFDELVEETKQTVSKSVEMHLEADVPVGAFLSGGVDSAYTVAEAAKHTDLKTYTVGFNEKHPYEAKDAAENAKLIGVSNETIRVSPEEYLEHAAQVQYHMDEPLGNPSAHLLFELSKRASKDYKAVLSGEGADEMFCGYNVYKEPLTIAWYSKLPQPLRKTLYKISDKIPGFPAKNLLRRRAGDGPKDWYLGNSNIFSNQEQKLVLKSEFVKENYSPFDHTKKYAQIAQKNNWSEITTMQYIDINIWLVQEILQKADKMSMAHSLELRVPLMDIEIWKAGLVMPTKMKISKQNTKRIFRAASRSVLDDIASERKKRAFPSPLDAWLKTDLYQEKITSYFTNNIAKTYFETENLLQLLSDHKTGIKNNNRKIWTIFAFLLWHEEFFTKR